MTPDRLGELIRRDFVGFASVALDSFVKRYGQAEDHVIAAYRALRFPMIRRAGAGWIVNPRGSAAWIPKPALEDRQDGETPRPTLVTSPRS